MAEKKRKSPTRQTVKFEAFARIATQLDMSVADLIEATGQTRAGAATWAKRGWVSKTTYLAAEGLLRRSRKKATSSTLFVVDVPNGKRDMFEQIMNGLGFNSEVAWRND